MDKLQFSLLPRYCHFIEKKQEFIIVMVTKKYTVDNLDDKTRLYMNPANRKSSRKLNII